MTTVVQLNALLQAISLRDGLEEEVLSHYLKIIVNKIISSNLLGTSDEAATLSIKCLINISSESKGCNLLYTLFECQKRRVLFIKILSNFLANFSSTFIVLRQLIVDLISNLTRDSTWSREFADYIGKKLMKQDIEFSNYFSDCLPVLVNLTNQAIIRRRICSSHRFLSHLIKLFSESNDQFKRILVASVLKNCCFEDQYHLILINDLCVLNTLLMPLCGPEDKIDDDDRALLPQSVQLVTGNPNTLRESSIELMLTICQLLFQCCATCQGRTSLRSNGVYFVLRELHKFLMSKLDSTKNEETSYKEVLFYVEQIVDQLICEEHEREKRFRECSLRDIDADSIEKPVRATTLNNS